MLYGRDLIRFWNKVDSCDGSSDDCWNWIGGCFQSGYGVFQVDNKNQRAHRIVYEMYFGPIPGMLRVCHHCDNKRCVRPDHLFLGTDLDNVRDCRKKKRGRDRNGRTFDDPPSPDAIRTARALWEAGTSYRDISNQTGIRISSIYLIVKRINYKDIE